MARVTIGHALRRQHPYNQNTTGNASILRPYASVLTAAARQPASPVDLLQDSLLQMVLYREKIVVRSVTSHCIYLVNLDPRPDITSQPRFPTQAICRIACA